LTGTVVKAPAEVVDLPVDGNRQVASPAEALETARVDLVELIRPSASTWPARAS
jgi:hypothetical protein